jgi:hypothetical protein
MNEVQALQMSTEDSNEDQLDPHEISISDYRKGSEDIFYNIYLIFIQNFGEPGAVFFFQCFSKILIEANINDDSIINDESKLIVVETVMLVIKSVVDCFEMSDVSCKPILDFTNCILNSKLIYNEKMVVNFLLFLDQASPYIGKDELLYKNTIEFLLNISKSKALEKICTLIILEITDFVKIVNLDVFQMLYNFYIQYYDSIQFNSVSNLSEALCNTVGIQDADKKIMIGLSTQELLPYYLAIIKPASERIQRTYQYISNLGNISINEDYTKIKLEILKNYQIHHNVLRKSYFLDSVLLLEMFHTHLQDTLNITEEIFKIFVRDPFLIKEITKTYIKVIHNLAENCVDYFDKFNEIMLNAYLQNNENYTCLIVLKYLYSETANGSAQKLDYVAGSFLALCDVINKNVVIMKKNQIEVMDIYAQFFFKVVDSLKSLEINQNILYDIIKLFLEVLKTITEISLNKNIVRALSRIISNEAIIPKDIIYPKFHEIVDGVFSCCDHFDSATILEVK